LEYTYKNENKNTNLHPLSMSSPIGIAISLNSSLFFWVEKKGKKRRKHPPHNACIPSNATGHGGTIDH
jgi:hypothetical protein